ncbi:hypothetical protein HDV06_001599 [Boothiomyces sp. JEL0866]|nr:hypothetical protein HDV06_001599 [Boothiomyces sp. JEL0866]
MEQPKVHYQKAGFFFTGAGNKIAKDALIYGGDNIGLKDHCIVDRQAILRGDLRRSAAGPAVAIQMGSYCYAGKNVVIKPPFKVYKQTFSHFPCKVGDFVFIDDNTLVEAAAIGSFVHIGKNCVIGGSVVIKDCCKILDGAIIPPGTVVPPFTVYGQTQEDWTEGAAELMEYRMKEFYHEKFVEI